MEILDFAEYLHAKTEREEKREWTDFSLASHLFRLIFSAQPFPGYQTKVVWRRREAGGNWYYSEKYDQEGWLCPALFKYFRRAPKDIYVKAEAK